jgi:hypothetical protein
MATMGCFCQLPRHHKEFDRRILTAMIPKTRLQVAVRAFPVPLCGVGNSSGVKPYNTAYMTLLLKLKAQFQPKRDCESSAVVDAYRNTPVTMVESESVPFLPNRGSSTSTPPSKAPGTPTAAMMSEFRYVRYVEPSPKSAPRVAWMYGR